MDAVEVDRLVTQLSAGFEALQDEYHQLYSQHQNLERKLKNARGQYNELAKLYGSEQTTTPPLSLSSSPALPKEDTFAPQTASDILDSKSKYESANKVRTAIAAANILKRGLPAASDSGATHGVKIWSGPSADRPDGSSSMMPSIAESPLEQDFTVEGKPSQLGCPFASMARKKLSSHAASVLSRYNQNGSVAGTASTPPSNASRVNGRESLSRRQSRRASMVDPIKAEICGMSDHETTSPMEKAPSVKAPSRGPTERQLENADVGVCPIRFLDQHSPEEVATYFENHKHELPRSHEVCVMRYQSNEEQIKQLDEKYGNLVSMIQGLGQKHKEMLPEEPADADEEDDAEPDRQSDEKIRKWASSVSAQAPEAGTDEDSEDRLPHFERPVREIRVGESPSRPWGIHIPAQYLEKVGDEQESEPAQVVPPPAEAIKSSPEAAKKPGKCPFDHNALKAMGMSTSASNPHKPIMMEPVSKPGPAQGAEDDIQQPRPTNSKSKPAKPTESSAHAENKGPPPIIINGPVFIGYSPEDAIRILKESGPKMNQ